MKGKLRLSVAVMGLLAGCGSPVAATPTPEIPSDLPATPTQPPLDPTSAAAPTAEASALPSSATETATPLSADSDVETIRRRILLSHTTWQSLWLEAEITEYPPEGSDLLVQFSRLQALVRQPAEALILRGALAGDPTSLWVSDGLGILEADLTSGAISESEIPPFALEPFFAPEAISDTITPHPFGSLFGYPAAELIFPTALAQRQGTYEIIGEDSVAGREALIIDWTPDPTGLIADRFRIDVETGMVLRQQNLGKTGAGEVVQTDILVTRIIYNPTIPEGAFALSVPEIPLFLPAPAAE
jgi:hypothetical protein